MDEHPRKSGSEKRQRTAHAIARLTPAEREQVGLDADRAGLALGSYMRAKLFAGSQPRAVRSPPIDRKALAQLLAWLGRLNGNVYQISRAVNFGEWFETDELKVALKEITDMRNAVLAALGREAV
jgi:hypothetical protein